MFRNVNEKDITPKTQKHPQSKWIVFFLKKVQQNGYCEDIVLVWSHLVIKGRCIVFKYMFLKQKKFILIVIFIFSKRNHLFLAVQDSSIGDLVTHWVSDTPFDFWTQSETLLTYLPDLPTWPTYLTYPPDLSTWPTYLTFLPDLPAWTTFLTYLPDLT